MPKIHILDTAQTIAVTEKLSKLEIMPKAQAEEVLRTTWGDLHYAVRKLTLEAEVKAMIPMSLSPEDLEADDGPPSRVKDPNSGPNVTKYPYEFRTKVIKDLMEQVRGPHRIKWTATANKYGVSVGTCKRWLGIG